jgi:hypothetical protein
MKLERYIAAMAVVCCTASAGCVVVPIPVTSHTDDNFCPPGQAKKGRCAPESGGGFCPPGQAKKGAC